MSEQILEVEAQTLTGTVQRFRCAKIVAINGTPFEEFCNKQSTTEVEELREAIIHLNGRIEEISNHIQNFAYRNELMEQVERLNQAFLTGAS